MSERGPSRRRLLGGAAAAGLGAAGLSGCSFGRDDDPAPAPTADPLEPLLGEALTLAAAYDRAVVAQPALGARLAPLAADHRAHADELARVIGQPLPSGAAPAPSGGQPTPSGGEPAAPAGDLAALRRAEQAAQRSAVAACRQAPPARAALIGSIAACRATHAEALR